VETRVNPTDEAGAESYPAALPGAQQTPIEILIGMPNTAVSDGSGKNLGGPNGL